MPRGAKGGKCGRVRGARWAAAAAPWMQQAVQTPREQPERDAQRLRELALRPRRSPPFRALAQRAPPRTVEESRSARRRSWHIGLTLERPRLLELAGFRKRRGSFQQRRAVRLVGEVADTPKILRQERRLLRNSPAEFLERGIHVARFPHVLPVSIGHLVLRRARFEGPRADPRLFCRPDAVRIGERIVDRRLRPEEI